MDINEFMRKHRKVTIINGTRYQDITPHIVCGDGLKMSVQAGGFLYCSPRVDGASHYDSVEIGFPSERIEEIMEWAEDAKHPTDTVYGWVPVDIVDAVIEKHGGIDVDKSK